MADDLDRLIAGLSDRSALVGVIDDPSNAIKAQAAEFGLGNNPSRPFLDPAAGRVEIESRHVDALLDDGPAAMLELFAGDVADAVRSQIDSNTPPPLSPSTIDSRRRRGNPSTATLIDTGALRRSIRVVIE